MVPALQGFWTHPFLSLSSAHMTVTLFPCTSATQRLTDTQVVIPGVIHKNTTCLWQRPEPGKACHASSPQPFPDPPPSAATTHFPLPAFILHHFHSSFKTLHCSTFNSLRRKVFYSTHYCFYQPNYIPVTSHQLIFHGHILIDINCITSPYLRISQALYHSFHYFAGLADL